VLSPDSNRLYVVFVEDNVPVQDSSGATSQNTFLGYHTPSGFNLLGYNVASVSDQAIDNRGHAMVDIVTTSGAAYEVHAGGVGLVYLTSGVKSAKAGDGVSYVLLNNGMVYEYHDSHGTTNFVDSNVVALDAGTDQFGVNAVDLVYGSGAAWEHSDTSGWHFLANGVARVSAGRNGAAEMLLGNGNAYHFNEAAGSFTFLASNVAQIASGTDTNGNLIIDLVFAGGTDVLFANGNAYEHDATSMVFLTGGVVGVA